jgi:teichuronic acid biosynthesis glycosyltransferase TuaC
MKVLVLTNMYPTKDKPLYGTFIKEQEDALRKEGVDIDIFMVDGSDHKLNYVWGIFRLWAWLLTHKYDLIHAHYVFSGIIARMQFLYPIVLTHHGPEFWTWQFIPCKIITPLVNKVILVSPEMEAKLNFKKVNIIPCGIDFDVFKPTPKDEARKELGLPRDKKIILWAGNNLRPEKRYDIVEAAVALVKQKDPSIEFLLVNNQPHERMPLYYSACDVLLLVSDAEGSPMVVKEAMACNMPVVSVRVGDTEQVIGKTEGCHLCTQDPPDVAEKLMLSLDYGQRTTGRRDIAYLEQGAIARKIKAIYEDVLKKKKRKQ